MKNLIVLALFLLMAASIYPQERWYSTTVTDSMSPAVTIGLPPPGKTRSIVGLIVVDTAWTAAKISFQVVGNAGTLYDLFLDGAEYTVDSVAINRFISIPPNKIINVNNIKIRSGTKWAQVNQIAPRTVKIKVIEF